MVQPSVRFKPALTLALAFLFSVCSLSYQQILVYALFDVSGDFVLSQSLGLGAFLLGMGSGTWAAAKGGIGRLILAEAALSLLGFVSIFTVYALEVLLRYFYPALTQGQIVYAFLPLVFAVGFCTGQEVPLLMRLSPSVPPAKILGLTYFGGLLALILAPSALLPALDLPKAAFVTALVNFCLAFFLAWQFIPRRWPQIAALLFALALLPWLKFESRWRDLHLKFIYFPVAYTQWEGAEKDWENYDAMDPPVRKRSRYQWIDVLPESETNAFSIYLDRKFQLNALTERRYHEALVEGGIQLLGRVPKRALILGGGDGLLLGYLLKHPEVESVELAELDPAMLELARTNGELKRLNGNAFADPRVTAHEGDAFAFLRANKDEFDMILLDFPLPATYELSLLYTREFYALARERLDAGGLLLMDFAMPDEKLDGLAVLALTLRAAGFTKPLAFGHEDLFLAMAADGRELKFDYEKAPTNQVLRSLAPLQEDFIRAASKRARENSLFFPYRFEFDYPASVTEKPLPPELGRVLFRRYGQFHAREFYDFTKWPAPLVEALKNPGGSVHWEHRFEGPRNSAILHWFDDEHPAALRALWKNAFGVPDGDWFGITYDGASGKFVTHVKTPSGYKSSDGTETRRNGRVEETLRDNEILYTRYFSQRQLNPVPGSREDDLLQKIFAEFMIMPSSFTMSSKVKIRGMYYP